MNEFSSRRLFSRLAMALIPVLLAGCATTIQSHNSATGAAPVAAGETLVIGRLIVVRNGETDAVSDSPFAGSPKLELTDVASGTAYRAEVGRDGTFAWTVPTGLYRVSALEIAARGQSVVFPTYLSFAASTGNAATYVGTLTLEVDVTSGYYGIEAVAESMIVQNDCQADCDALLAQTGLDRQRVDVALASPNVAVASVSAQ